MRQLLLMRRRGGLSSSVSPIRGTCSKNYFHSRNNAIFGQYYQRTAAASSSSSFVSSVNGVICDFNNDEDASRMASRGTETGTTNAFWNQERYRFSLESKMHHPNLFHVSSSLWMQQPQQQRRYKSAVPSINEEPQEEDHFVGTTRRNGLYPNRDSSSSSSLSWREDSNQRNNNGPRRRYNNNDNNYHDSQRNHGGSRSKNFRQFNNHNNNNNRRNHQRNPKQHQPHRLNDNHGNGPQSRDSQPLQSSGLHQQQPLSSSPSVASSPPPPRPVVGKIERQQPRGEGGTLSHRDRFDFYGSHPRRLNNAATATANKSAVDASDSLARLRAVFLTRPDVKSSPASPHSKRVPQEEQLNNDDETFGNLVDTLQQTSNHILQQQQQQQETSSGGGENYQEAFLTVNSTSASGAGTGAVNHISTWRNPNSNQRHNNTNTNNNTSNQFIQAIKGEEEQQKQKQLRNRRNHRSRRENVKMDQPMTLVLPLHVTSIPLVNLGALTRTSLAKLLYVIRTLREEVIITTKDGETLVKNAGYVARHLTKQERRNAVSVSIETAELIAMELGYSEVTRGSTDSTLEDDHLLLNMDVNAALLDEDEVLLQQMEMEERAAEAAEDDILGFDEDRYQSRPPVVCIMGHVDHGKTTLMDALRQFAAKKSGGAAGASASSKTSKKSKKKNKASSQNGIAKVAGTEAGGITQVISAFQVTLPDRASMDDEDDFEVLSSLQKDDDKSNSGSTPAAVTFLDTPGHAAFSKMRHCGMYATDVLVLVIAGDDGLKEQTKEIINLYKTQSNKNLKLVVAMTKIDIPGVGDTRDAIRMSQMRIENELLSEGIETVGVGGTVPIVPVSGITSQGVEELVRVLAQRGQGLMWDTKVEEGMGVVLDARMSKGLGVVADCVVRTGQFIKDGESHVVVERQTAKIRLIKDVNNKNITVAGPSTPVRIVGLESIPKAGEAILCVRSEERASELAEKRDDMFHATGNHFDSIGTTATGMKRPERIKNAIADLEITNGKTLMHRKRAYQKLGLVDKDATQEDVIYAETYGTTRNEISDTNNYIRIPVIIKADADGTLHALESALFGVAAQSKRHSILIDPIQCGVGPISGSDIRMALESNAPIFAFNVPQADKLLMKEGERNGVKMLHGNIIYSILDEAKTVLAEYLPVTLQEHVHGRAVVQAVFHLSGKQQGVAVAGCQVTEGNLFLDKVLGGTTTGPSKKVAYRVIRNGTIVAGGTSTTTDTPMEDSSQQLLRASSLKKFKENVPQTKRGEECGISLEGFDTYEQGDVIECYTTEEVRSFD